MTKSITPESTLSNLSDEIELSSPGSKVTYSTIDGSMLPESVFTFNNLRNTPFIVNVNDEKFILNLSKNFTLNKEEFDVESRLAPNEETFYVYCKSIGIPNKDSEVLGSFLYKMYESLPDHADQGHLISTQSIKNSMFNALSGFRSITNNEWGTSRTSILKNILSTKEKELEKLSEMKEKLDKKALRRANLMLYMGGSVLLAQFSFIVGGTYFLYCWDVMEPMAYLMLTSNLTLGFGYYWWTNDELDFQPLQGKFKSRIALAIYRNHKFDYPMFKQLESEVLALRELINKSV